MTKKSVLFSVGREKLYRKNGSYINHDVLYRKDNGKVLSVVSKDYHLVKHSEVIDFTHRVLERVGVSGYNELISGYRNGASMQYNIQFPHLEFKTDLGDGYYPSLWVRNSYDGSSGITLNFGVYRIVCINGLIVGKTEKVVYIRHNRRNIDFRELEEPFVKKIVATLNGGLQDKLSRIHKRLNSTDFRDYLLKMLTLESVTLKFKKFVLNELFSRGIISGASSMVKLSKDDLKEVRKELVSNIKNTLNAYELLNIMTYFISHNISKANIQATYFNMVRRLFHLY